MKTLYIECNMGAAGDMLMSALLELVPDKAGFVNEINSVGLDGAKFYAEKTDKCGITGTHMHVIIDGVEEGDEHYEQQSHHEHHSHHEYHSHHNLEDVRKIIMNLSISDNVKKHAMEIYEIIAKAEAQVHGKEMNNIHFHEVGTMDAICDIVGTCMLIEKIGADKIIVSPINVGSGKVKCAHGILPVPAPATTLILKGMPIYGSSIKGELCTPTGAAILKKFADEFGEMPKMELEKVGYGMGTKDFDQANCVRMLLGKDSVHDAVTELACNLDDMTGEEIGFAMEKLLDSGALDVYAQPIIMKKSRPAYKLICMCRLSERDSMIRLIFTHTTTIGIREYSCERAVLNREITTKKTQWGNVRMKTASGYGIIREKIEFDDLAEIAEREQISLLDVKKRCKL